MPWSPFPPGALRRAGKMRDSRRSAPAAWLRLFFVPVFVLARSTVATFVDGLGATLASHPRLDMLFRLGVSLGLLRRISLGALVHALDAARRVPLPSGLRTCSRSPASAPKGPSHRSRRTAAT